MLYLTSWTKVIGMTNEPQTWDAASNQGAPAPYIPVLRGLTLQAYADALESYGEKRDTGETSAGRGYGERITVITDPATGIIGYVTQWEWNSRVEWGVWTPQGFEQRGKSDVHTWSWDAVKTVRRLVARAAFREASPGEVRGYWAQAQDSDAARAAHDEWLTRRLAGRR